MKTARLWLALRAASRLSLYFCVMWGAIMLTRVSTVWWKEAEKRWFLDSWAGAGAEIMRDKDMGACVCL